MIQKKMLNEQPDLAKLRIVSNEFQIPSMINFYLNPTMEAICLSIDYHETPCILSYMIKTVLRGKTSFIFMTKTSSQKN